MFYRLNVIELRLAPLRERLDDLDELVDAILARLGSFEHKVVLAPGVLDVLKGYSFPGNVRELENILERALAFSNDGVISAEDLALKGGSLPAAAPGAVPAAAPNAQAVSASPASGPAASPVPSAPAAVSEAAVAPAVDAAPAREPAMPPLPVFDVLPSNLPAYLEAVERDIITRALAQTNYNRTQAAQLLGISFRQLRYQMQKLNIQDPG